MPPAWDAAGGSCFAAGAGETTAVAPAAASAAQIRRRSPRPLMPQLSAPRVASDVGRELGSACVMALLDVDGVPAGVVEDGGRKGDRRLEGAGDPLARVAVARVGDGELVQERMSRGGGVLGV